MTTANAPDGFDILEPASPHLDSIGPVWQRSNRDGPPTFALRVESRHLNNRGLVHGGVIATLADITCGYTFRHLDLRGPAPVLTTTHLATTYLGSAAADDWLEADGTVVKLGRSLASSTALVSVEGRPVAHAAALFHVARPATGTPPAGSEDR